MKSRRIIARLTDIAGRLGLREVTTLMVLLIIVLAAWAFIGIASEVMEKDTGGFDEWVLRSLRQAEDPAVPIGPRWLPGAARDITSLGGSAVVLLVIFASAGYLALAKKWHEFWLVLGATISGQILSSILKSAFGRERPTVVPHAVDVVSASFPSGHAMISAVVYLTLAALLMRLAHQWRAKVYILTVAIILTVLIGCTRIYLGVHFPTDVLAGWTAGLSWALLWWLIARYMQRRGAIEKTA